MELKIYESKEEEIEDISTATEEEVVSIIKEANFAEIPIKIHNIKKEIFDEINKITTEIHRKERELENLKEIKNKLRGKYNKARDEVINILEQREIRSDIAGNIKIKIIEKPVIKSINIEELPERFKSVRTQEFPNKKTIINALRYNDIEGVEYEIRKYLTIEER